MEENREKFSSGLSVFFATLSSAVGIGNIWMFPYRMGSNGGAVFLIPYLFFVLVLGTTGLITEFSFGRMFGKGNLEGTRISFEKAKLNSIKFFSYFR